MPSPATTYGLLRSIFTYYGMLPFRARRLLRFYAQFIRPGDLVFDLGAHVGSRLWVFRRVGTEIVAVEPQPVFAGHLRRWYEGKSDVTVIEAAIGASAGEATMLVSRRWPTVTTLSDQWSQQVREVRSFAGVRWDEKRQVSVTTLDALIAAYGLPAFCKIDVEGYELEVLKGLSRPIPALSLEYVPPTMHIGLACIERLGELGEYVFNWSIGEMQRLESAQWLDGNAMAATLAGLPNDTRPGDLYARLSE